MTDKLPTADEMLNFLQEQSDPRFGWAYRLSATGRGWRLHETTRDDAYPTVREAIAAVMEADKRIKAATAGVENKPSGTGR